MKSILAVALALVVSDLALAMDNSAQYNKLLLDAHTHITKDLKDPDSAIFRSEYIQKTPSKNESMYFVCGEINAKNSYGGYVGYAPYYYYVVNSDVKAGIRNEENAIGFDIFYKVVCKNTSPSVEVIPF